ncbi:MAG TPA: endonuclease/exonuclease/phosphatase family protein [Anaerolineae bacterium]|jgi:hypothetical protein
MITFLFWNLNQKPLESMVANLTLRHDVDILMLVECKILSATILQTLNSIDKAQYFFTRSNCEKVVIYAKFSPEFFQPVLETNRLTIRELNLPGLTTILLAVTHFQSKRYWSDDSQAEEVLVLSKHILKAEEEAQHSRTILVGDLNMNPFETGLVSASKLNAVMTREIALRGSRTVAGRSYPYFYNPMWGHFGDADENPPGTYYYNGSEHKTFFWNIFDQVLLRPELVDVFQNESLKILSTDGTNSFLKRGLPDSSVASDHLPIIFKLNL